MDALDAALRAVTILGVLAAIPSGIGALVGWAFADADAEADAEADPAAEARLGAAPMLVLAGALAGLTFVPPPHAHAATSPLALAGALLGAVVAGSSSVRGIRRPRRLRATPPLWAGALLGASPLLALTALLFATELASDPRSSEAAEEARTRILLVPWDARAQLALGFDAGRRGALPALEAHLEAAERAGADEVATLELRAELEAHRGRCGAARDAFDRALALRTERAMADVLDRPLSLGDYAIPEALVRLCGL